MRDNGFVYAEGAEYLADGAEGRVAFGAEGAVQAFSAQASLSGKPGEAAIPCLHRPPKTEIKRLVALLKAHF